MRDIPFVYDESSPSCLKWAISTGKVKVGDNVGALENNSYWGLRFKGKNYRAHRLVWEIHYGPIPVGKQIDHINGVKSDNRIDNLRLATKSQNQQNKKISILNTCGLKGVRSKNNGRYWISRIKLNASSIHIGTFENKYLAYAAYCDKAIELHGEFARLF